MSVYPFAIDDDVTIPRVDDGVSEISGSTYNSLRDAVFALQGELGINPAGSAGTVATRLDVSLNSDGSIKTSALTSVGLVTLPIINSYIASNAGIQEHKLSLNHSTIDLYTLITAAQALLNSTIDVVNEISSDLSGHTSGSTLTSDGNPNRHVASHIDINAVTSDPRDVSFIWTGLLDKNGTLRSATHVASALLQINDDFTSHQNATSDAHHASSINIETDDFEEIPQEINTLQKLADYVDDVETLQIGDHRATQHSAGIPKIARAQSLTLPDGYSENVVPSTQAKTFLVQSPNTQPVDNLSNGDDVISFSPDNSTFIFDSQFAQVKVGDQIRVNYANGVESQFFVDSIRFTPGAEWIVRINGTNLFNKDGTDGYVLARIDRPTYDVNTYGVLAVASANATPTGSFDTILASAIIGHPRGATALGIGFDANQLDSAHYNLHLELYPDGDPTSKIISLPAIDVTGNAGATPGNYSLNSTVLAANNKFREIGFNYRFIAFDWHGEFGIMLADPINNASFSIVKGENSSGTLITGSYSNNVIGESEGNDFDALGFGSNHADVAGAAFTSSFADSTTAQLLTKVHSPLRHRNYVVNGRKLDTFASTYLANDDGYWDGYVSARTTVGSFTVETTYTVLLDLQAAGLKPGKTLVIQPTIEFDDALYNNVDYGRFIIKSVSFLGCTNEDPDSTVITVINGLHATGNGFGSSAAPTLPVRIYFSEDSVSFNNEHIINTTPTSQNYRRLHELYIDDTGSTFSHERARLPIQSETSSLLSTAYWHIENVSPKFRGYRDNSSTFNKYIRFFILSYDSTSGEFDGYLGQRVGSSISKVGPVTTGRKEVLTRFYDETNVDYIDLTFQETSTSAPGAAILSTAIPRYVDIEIFSGLRSHDELLLLATAEINWDPSSGQNIVQRITNQRQFGSISEDDLTESAIEFISAGNKYLHENGVIQGLDFDQINSSDDREIFYKGGIALVNGKILSINNISVTIPEVSESGDSLPATVDWAVCVNEFGMLEPIVVTSSKQQFFGTNGGNTYYIPSVTFAELIDTRKDLCPISIVTATIASITINDSDVLDVRKFIKDNGKETLVFSPTDYIGSFHTVSALKNWVNTLASSNPVKVKVRGTFSVTSSLDFTGFTSEVVLEGDGALFNVTANKGLLVDNNVTFKDITFNYNPSGITFTTNNKINSSNGCIYHASTTDINNLNILNCQFNSEASTQRPPFISFEIDNSDVISNVNIKDNKFYDSDTATQSNIAIVNKDAVLSSEPAVLFNVNIENNTSNKSQGIYLTNEISSILFTVGRVSGPGIRCFNVNIKNNNVGVIGFLASKVATTAELVLDSRRNSGLNIENNTVNIIGTIVSGVSNTTTVKGTTVVASSGPNVLSPFPSENIRIVNNHSKLLYILGDNDVANDGYSNRIISGNFVSAIDPTYLDQWHSTGFFGSTYQNWGIYVSDTLDDVGEILITDNILSAGADGYEFTTGIESANSANILDNIIRGIAADGYGIRAASSSTGLRHYIIKGNQIYRGAHSIKAYIGLEANVDKGEGLVVDNFFDHPTIDGSDTSVVTPLGFRANSWHITRNINQTGNAYIFNNAGRLLTSGTLHPLATDADLAINTGVGSLNSDDITFLAVGAVSSSNLDIIYRLETVLPPSVYVVSISITATKVDAAPNGGTGSLKLYDIGGLYTTLDSTPAWNFGTQGTGASVTSTITTGNKDYRVTNAGPFSLQLDINALTFSGAGSLTFSSILCTYRW